MRITVFGASGRTGVPLVRQALDRGHEVVAFVRSPDGFPVAGEGLTVVEGDAYTGDGVTEAVSPRGQSVDAVVSVLGQTGDGPDDLLTVAGDRITQAMAEAGVERFVTLVGAGVREPGESPSLQDRVMGGLLKLLVREVLADAETHVEHVRATDLDWTVVRAPRLVDGEGEGDYRAGDIDLGFESVARADVARLILDCLEGDLYRRELPKVGGPE
ncbi:NAD(P)-dependent oxidoreductase [Haloglomus litoreum]|uniref:NAD(P)-dependent oxidoreductase n=1 Tax=Haloglomus litoreum TaxID=3034026 RepID=UPI0023E83798|nr:NAD(P)H-binding protein [Haloglomus sp. DT116]